MPYLRRVYTAPADLEDLVVADLWEAGTLGVQTLTSGDDVRFDAWFPVGSPPALPQRPGVRLEVEENLPDMDWLADYREKAQPFPVAGTFFVDPREPEEAPADLPEGRRLLRLPARTAFGTGSHESTSLTLELLETMDLAGARVLDVGTGTGILSFAALRLGARQAVAYDVDPAAPVHARDNSTLNGLRPLLFAGTSEALRADLPVDLRFDLELINVVPEQILPEMPGLVGRLKPGGEALLSGILAERGDEVLEHLRPLGLVERDRRAAGEWIAFRVALEAS